MNLLCFTREDKAKPAFQSVDPANAGLHHAISFLLPLQGANPWISHADLWSMFFSHSQLPRLQLIDSFFLSSGRSNSCRGNGRSANPLGTWKERL